MLHPLIEKSKNEWLARADCPARAITDYIKKRGKLRAAQIGALESYLFLKIHCANQPLWRLIADNTFDDPASLPPEHRHTAAHLPAAARALYQLAAAREKDKARMPELAKFIRTAPAADFTPFLRRLFYGVNYPDYLFSLPMGAGKTYLMAAIITLDLHYALQAPTNPAWGHNFLALIPSGLKSSLTASLSEIRDFDGTWVLPPASARRVRRHLHFEVLDEAKSSKKSTRLRDPNADKINRLFPDPFGAIIVVNAEKLLTRKTGDALFAPEELDNELRAKLAELPRKGILIDEAHHTAKQEVRLRQVVNWWADAADAKTGGVAAVAGFSGTPYLHPPDTLPLDTQPPQRVKLHTMANTVYFYPLRTAVQNFLKRPTVRSAAAGRTEIIRRAVREFEERYGAKRYRNGAVAKCAIYCGTIDTLENEVHPLLRELGIPATAILKYYGRNKSHQLSPQNAAQFRALDAPESPHRYILLVQIGKEGWNCKSLTAVVLSGAGDSPKNMVLQTCCRCLRQVDDSDNTALIWLNDANAAILNAQLRQQQSTDIAALDAVPRARDAHTPRHSRMAHLALPPIDFYQLRVRHTAVAQEDSPNTRAKLTALLTDMDNMRKNVAIHTGDLVDPHQSAEFADHHQGELSFHRWVARLSKNSFGQLRVSDFMRHGDILAKIHAKFTHADLRNQRYDLTKLNNAVALAFSIRRTLHSTVETVAASADILLEQKLAPIAADPNAPAVHPDGAGVAQILHGDTDPDFIADFHTRQQSEVLAVMASDLPPQEKMAKINAITHRQLHPAAAHKERTFHYLPYHFSQSRFEREILQGALALQTRHAVEIYYNGERGLTEFVIECHEHVNGAYAYLGRYTPDFLIVRRTAGRGPIRQALILETKGRGFAADSAFTRKKQFVTGEFIIANNQKFGYRKFAYLYLEDSARMDDNLKKIHDSIHDFFTEEANAD